MAKRVFLLIMDGFGIGQAPDSESFGDKNVNTCQHILTSNPDLELPVLRNIGLLNKDPKNLLIELNPNKDTLSGISEMFGTILPKMHTFKEEIPIELIQKLESGMGVKTLFGKTCSGTKIMKELGCEHLLTGFPILYTSQDSVLQLLAHEEVIDCSLLYYYCAVIQDIIEPLYHIGRVIARPFIGYTPETFKRTIRRKDFVFHSGKNIILNNWKEKGIEIFGNRILMDIFGPELITLFDGNTNEDLFKGLLSVIKKESQMSQSLYVIDFEDFDMLYGHRRDPIGYAKALVGFDKFLNDFLPLLSNEDLVVVTADHGNDPTCQDHTDHTREIVPLITYSKNQRTKTYGKLEGFFHISKIISSYLGVDSVD